MLRLPGIVGGRALREALKREASRSETGAGEIGLRWYAKKNKKNKRSPAPRPASGRAPGSTAPQATSQPPAAAKPEAAPRVARGGGNAQGAKTTESGAVLPAPTASFGEASSVARAPAGGAAAPAKPPVRRSRVVTMPEPTPPPTAEELATMERKNLAMGAVLLTAAGAAYYTTLTRRDPLDQYQEQTVTNWSGTHHARTRRLYEPENPEELQALVERAHRHERRIRPIGSGISPNGLGLSEAGMVSTAHMDSVLSIDKAARTVTVRPGARVRDVSAELARHGLALETYASIREQTVAGYTQAGCHGTGVRVPPADDAVVALELCTPAQGVQKLRLDDPDEARVSLFRLARLSLGTLGVASELTLRAVPLETVRETQTVETRAEVRRRHAERVVRHAYLRYLWIPYVDRVVVFAADVVGGADGATTAAAAGATAPLATPALAGQREAIEQETGLSLEAATVGGLVAVKGTKLVTADVEEVGEASEGGVVPVGSVTEAAVVLTEGGAGGDADAAGAAAPAPEAKALTDPKVVAPLRALLLRLPRDSDPAALEELASLFGVEASGLVLEAATRGRRGTILAGRLISALVAGPRILAAIAWRGGGEGGEAPAATTAGTAPQDEAAGAAEAAASGPNVSLADARQALLALAPLDAAWVRRVNAAEAEAWAAAAGSRIALAPEILSFDCGGDQWVTEVAVPAGSLEEPTLRDLEAVEEALALVEGRGLPVPAPIEQRWSAASTSPLSPASGNNGDITSWIGIIMYAPSAASEGVVDTAGAGEAAGEAASPGVPTWHTRSRAASAEAFAAYSELVVGHLRERHAARVHWAKLEVPTDPEGQRTLRAQLEGQYPMQAWREARRNLDPKNILGSPALDKVLL